MLKKYTCIICPNGCEIEAEVLDGEIKSVSGFTCKRGEEYVRQEILAPKRTIASSVAVKNGELPDGPKVGSVAVSPRGDLRMPSDASARIWMEELEALNTERR